VTSVCTGVFWFLERILPCREEGGKKEKERKGGHWKELFHHVSEKVGERRLPVMAMLISIEEEGKKSGR